MNNNQQIEDLKYKINLLAEGFDAQSKINKLLNEKINDLIEKIKRLEREVSCH